MGGLTDKWLKAQGRRRCARGARPGERGWGDRMGGRARSAGPAVAWARRRRRHGGAQGPLAGCVQRADGAPRGARRRAADHPAGRLAAAGELSGFQGVLLIMTPLVIRQLHVGSWSRCETGLQLWREAKQ